MQYHFSELIDAAKVFEIMERFHGMTNISCTLTDVDGTVLFVGHGKPLGSRWQRICTDFHRLHPGSTSHCLERDVILSKNIVQSKKYSLYQCKNGLVDVAVPIYLDGAHVANLFTGQFLFTKPDLGYFRRQATYYSYDEDTYLEALEEVPVLNKEAVDNTLVSLENLAELLSGICAKEKERLDLENNL